MASESRPGRVWYVVSALFAIAGMAIAVGLVIYAIVSADDANQFVVPGRHAFVVEKPGKHRVWNDHRTVFQGRTYDVSRALPDGVRIIVTGTDGRPVEVISGGSATSTTTAAERVAIASFEAASPGRYEIVVEGDFKPRVFSVGRDFVPWLVATIFGAFFAIFTGIAVACVLGLWTFLKRHPTVLEARPVSAASLMAAPVKTQEQVGKDLATVVYAAQATSFLLIFTLIAGVIVNYITREQVKGTWIESHYRWQIHTFWWWLVWALVGLALLVVVVGFVIWLVDAIWLIYRIVKGWVRLSEGKPMYSEEKKA
jgi:uncharacterized membrane protein